jgi:hypothetical protein
VKNFFMIGVGPLVGGTVLLALLAKSGYDLSKPENSESGDSWLGLGPPLVIALFFLVLGIVLMLLQQSRSPGFFKTKPSVVDPAVFEKGPAA